MTVPGRRLMFGVLAAVLLAVPARAQTAGITARDLVYALGIPVEVASSARATLVALFARQNPHLGRVVPETVDELLLPGVLARIGDLLDAVTALFARSFDAEECRELLAFELSPVGQRRIAAERDRRVGLTTDLDPYDRQLIERFEANGAGRRLAAEREHLTREVAALGRAWGTRVTGDVIADHAEALRERGFRL